MASHGVDNNVSKKKNTFPSVSSLQSPFFRAVTRVPSARGALKSAVSVLPYFYEYTTRTCVPHCSISLHARAMARAQLPQFASPLLGAPFSLTEHSLRTGAASAVSALSSAAAFSLLAQLPRPSLLFQLAAERILSIPSLLPWLPTIRTHSRTW